MAKWITTASMKTGDIVFGVESDMSITKYKVTRISSNGVKAENLQSSYYSENVGEEVTLSDKFGFYQNYWDAHSDSIKGITGNQLYAEEFGP